MKYRANITNLLRRDNKMAESIFSMSDAVKRIRSCGYNIVSDRYNIYVEADSVEAADLIECLNFNI